MFSNHAYDSFFAFLFFFRFASRPTPKIYNPDIFETVTRVQCTYIASAEHPLLLSASHAGKQLLVTGLEAAAKLLFLKLDSQAKSHPPLYY